MGIGLSVGRSIIERHHWLENRIYCAWADQRPEYVGTEEDEHDAHTQLEDMRHSGGQLVT